MTEEPLSTASKPGAVFWTTAVLGWAVIAWGVAGVVRHHVDTRPADLLRFVAGGILLHDLVVVPLALVAAYLLNRAVPAPWRRWVQVTLVVAAPLALFAFRWCGATGTSRATRRRCPTTTPPTWSWWC